MELNSKKLERTSRLVYFTISAMLCLFLVLLSNRIIDDVDRLTESPIQEHFENKIIRKDLDKKLELVSIEIGNLNNKKELIEKTITTAKENYTNEKQSFDNWLQTRKTLGSPDKDQEVISRAKQLDEYYKIEQEWRVQLNAKQAEIDIKSKEQDVIQQKIDKEMFAASVEFDKAYKQYELKVFLIRLLFVGPILALGIFFFVRYRRHKFWPLYFGFTLFSIYTFFFGLVPYLPSYGGYVHYAVGILLSIGLGFYAIKTIRQFIEQKQAELKISTQERAKNVQTEVAEKALENHFCPSCGKDFLIKKWETPTKNNDSEVYKLVTNYCRHCGLELFKNCGSCGNKNFAHLPYCASCGETSSKANT